MTSDVRLAGAVKPLVSLGQYRRGMAYTFFSDKKKFQIVAKMNDVPGALAGLLEVLRSRVNLTSVQAQRGGNGEMVFSCFAEPLLPTEKAEALEKLLRVSGKAHEVQVTEGSDGLLVDSYFKGIENEDGKRILLFTRDGVNDMFDKMIEVFGTGGEVLLYREGASVGEANARELVVRMGKDGAARSMAMVLKMFTASGWGDATLVISEESKKPAVQVRDCFECSSELKSRRNCAFVKGLLTGSAKAILGPDVAYEETKCRLKGDDCCEFTPVVDSLSKRSDSDWY